MATFSAYQLRTRAGALAHSIIFLVRKQTIEPLPEGLREFVRTKYDQDLVSMDIEVVDAKDLKARITKLNKRR